jgi:hypothetical protein
MQDSNATPHKATCQNSESALARETQGKVYNFQLRFRAMRVLENKGKNAIFLSMSNTRCEILYDMTSWQYYPASYISNITNIRLFLCLLHIKLCDVRNKTGNSYKTVSGIRWSVLREAEQLPDLSQTIFRCLKTTTITWYASRGAA